MIIIGPPAANRLKSKADIEVIWVKPAKALGVNIKTVATNFLD